MAGGGTGQPNWFGCAKCRLKWDTCYRHGNKYPGTMDRIELTGRVRKVPLGRGGSRVVFTRYQYRCSNCGHVGWSRHYAVAKLADSKGIAPHHDDPQVKRC